MVKIKIFKGFNIPQNYYNFNILRAKFFKPNIDECFYFMMQFSINII